MTIALLFELIRSTIGEPASGPQFREFRQRDLVTWYRAVMEKFYRLVLPYEQNKFVSFNESIGNPPDFPPDYPEGGYEVPVNCYKLRSVSYKDPNSSDGFTLIRLIGAREWDAVSGLATTESAIAYGYVYDHVLYTKGIPTPRPLVRMWFNRGPNIPGTNATTGLFSAADLQTEVDAPPQYHEAIQFGVRSYARRSMGDTEDAQSDMAAFDAATMQAKGEFRQNGVEQYNKCIKMDEDYGGRWEDPIAGIRW